MSASDIQQKRMKTYFIESAKEILRGEGLKVASARNISERAGYSYATLYNYFEDLSTLIFECVRDFQSEIDETASKSINPEAPANEMLICGVTAWVNYFVQYPGIFELFFLERMVDTGHGKEIADLIYNSISGACLPGINRLKEEGKLTDNEAEDMLDSLRFEVTGMLLYYTNRKNPEDYTGLMKMLSRRLDRILNC